TLLGLAGKAVRLANYSEPLEGLASNKGFQPQNKPPVSRVVMIKFMVTLKMKKITLQKWRLHSLSVVKCEENQQFVCVANIFYLL
ncbi:hypothetical protein, partial [Bacillus litorisediminis]|uniref:hypothetical protein n=1 Tax=Bacillus litorisediminis TaxID=2922713 RepID=UPI001FAC23DD